MLSYTLSPASLSLSHTAPLFNFRILLCIMNRPQSFSVITLIAISFRPLYLGELKGGNLNKLISEYHLKRTRLTLKGRVHGLLLDLLVVLFSSSCRKENDGGDYFPMNLKRKLFVFPYILRVHHSCPDPSLRYRDRSLVGTNRCCFAV